MRRSIWTRIAVVLLVAAALFTLAGYLLAPRLIERGIASAISEKTGRRVEIQRVVVNPFKLSVEIDNLSTVDTGSVPRLSISRVTARIHVASLLVPGWSFRNLIVEAPRLLIPASDDSRNDLEQLNSVLAATFGGAGRLPMLDVGHLSITRGELQLPGASDEPGIAREPLEIAAINLSMYKLSTRREQRGEFDFTATVNQTARIVASGKFVPFPAQLDAAVDFTSLNVAEIGPVIRIGTELELESALMAGEVTMHFGDGLTTILGDIALQQITLVDYSTRAEVFAAAEALASQVVIGTIPFQASIGHLKVNTPQLQITRDANGSLQGVDWLRLLVDGPIRSQRIDIYDGRLDFKDYRMSVPVQFHANQIIGSIRQLDSRTAATTTVSVQGKIMSGAVAKISASWLTADPDLSSNMNLTLDDLDAVLLSPYLSALGGREIASGKLDLELEYRAHDKRFDFDNKISVAGFELGAHDENIDAVELPLDLAAALLRDSNGLISTTIPIRPGRIDREIRTEAVLRGAFSDFVTAIADSPFTVLGELAGWSGPDLGRVAFDSGSAALTASASGQLAILATALQQRPALRLNVNGRYDQVADRDALARQQMRLHVALASSTGPPGRAAVTPLVFTDPKVISILNEFAATRLRSENLTAIRERIPEQGVTYYNEVFEALIANETVSATALNSLARFRAQSIINELTGAGIDSDRLRLDTEIEAVEEQGQNNLVKLTVTL